LKLSVWPHPLVLDYGNAVVGSFGEVWGQAVLVVALLAGTTVALVRKPVLGFLGAWFFVILAPSSSVVPLVTQTIAEHRMYLPLAGIVTLGVAWFVACLGPRAAWPCILGGVMLGGVAHARAKLYPDPLAIWSDSVAHAPTSARAHNNLALELQRAG